MKKDFNTFVEKAGDEISLSHTERAQMRGVLQEYMAMKPLRITSAQPQLSWGIFAMHSRRYVAFALVVMLFVSSAGVSYAAEGALPGDALYVVKVNVNEPVAGALAVSNSAKVAWAMNVAGKRLEEAATLAAEGRLDTKTQVQLQTSFDAHASQAIANLDNQASTSSEMGVQEAVRFEAQLSEYERVLAQLGEGEDAANTLSASIRSQREHVAAIRIRSDDTADSTTHIAIAASRMREVAKKQLDDSKHLARKTVDALESSSAEVVAQQLEEASAGIADGDDLLEGDSASEALEIYRSALVATEKLGVFLQTSSSIHSRTGRTIAQADSRSSASQSADSARVDAASSAKAAAPAPTEPPVQATMMFMIEPESVHATSSAGETLEDPQSTDDASSRTQSDDREDDDKRGEDSDGRHGEDKNDALPVGPIIISVPPTLLR